MFASIRDIYVTEISRGTDEKKRFEPTDATRNSVGQDS